MTLIARFNLDSDFRAASLTYTYVVGFETDHAWLN